MEQTGIFTGDLLEVIKGQKITMNKKKKQKKKYKGVIKKKLYGVNAQKGGESRPRKSKYV
jgi:hypothetical protein